MSDFRDRLAALCAAEVRASKHDAERRADMIEGLALSLGFTAALVAKGDPKGIDTLLAGAEAYAHREAVEKAPLAEMLARVGVRS